MKNKLHHKLIILFLHIIFSNMLFAQINYTYPVGAIPGVIDVSPMGATTYTVTIEVVPGTQGIQPNLSVVYNSFSGMGIFGMKWSLAGLSAITRCGQIPYYDNDMTEIRFNGDDRFALDGAQLLIQSPANYGAVGAPYATEVENFVRVFSKGGTAGAPDYFIAYTDDGTIIEYGNTSGNTSNSKQILATNKVLSWCINKITDAHGNYMTFTYETSDGDIRIKEINYTGNTAAGITPYAKVQFTYTDNLLNPNTVFVGGYCIRQKKLLETITISYTSTLVRKYKFNYNLTITGEHSAHLKEIELYGEDGTTKLNPTRIEWGAQNTTIQKHEVTGLAKGKTLTGDFDGDGYTDIVVYRAGSSACDYYLYLNNRNGSFTNYTSGGHTPGSYVYAFDLDMDGRDELIFVEFVEIDNNKDTIWKCRVEKYYPQRSECDLGIIKNFHNAYFGRFHSDGKSDVLFLTRKTCVSLTYPYYWCLYNLLNRDGVSEYFFSDRWSEYSDIYIADINGNGKDNINVIIGDNTYSYEYLSGVLTLIHNTGFPNKWHHVYHGDFNGDGIQDILAYCNNSGSKYWRLHMGKGNNEFTHNGFYVPYLDPTPKNHQSSERTPEFPITIADINGDGKDEIIQLNKLNYVQTLAFYSLSDFLSDGSFTTTVEIINAPGSTTIFPSYSENRIWLGDFNGDGKVDILYGKPETSTENPYTVHVNKNEQYDFPQKITDGMGKIVQLTYQPQYFRAKNYYRESNTNYYTYQKYCLPVLKERYVQTGIDTDLRMLKYEYGSAMYSLSRRTFLGFGSFIVSENNNPIHKYEESYFGFLGWNAKQMIVPTSYLFKNGGQVNPGNINSKSFSYAVQDLPNRRFVPYCSANTEINYLSDIKINTTTNINNEGRVTATTVKTSDRTTNDWLHSETNTYYYKGYPLTNSNHKKTVPDKVITAQQYKNGSTVSPTISSMVTYLYNSKGLLTQMKAENDDGEITTTNGSYSLTGIACQKTVSAPGCDAKTEQYVLDPATHRFVETIIVEPRYHNFKTVFEYDPKTGNKKKETDINELSTIYTYDIFGNLKTATYPDATTTTVTTHWNYPATKPDNALFYTKTIATGKPELRIYYDVLGREVCRWYDNCYSDTRYNDRGQVEKTSYPYTNINETDPNKIWCSYTYDVNGRRVTEKAPYIDLTYKYNNRKVTVTDKLRNNIQTYKDSDALGRLIEAKDEGGIITYSYSVVKQINKIRHKTVITLGGAVTTIITDLNGNRLSLEEPNAGTIISTYNGFNELKTQTDALLNKTEFWYDRLGRVTKKENTNLGVLNQTIDYVYDNYTPSNKGRGKLYQVIKDNVLEETIVYDNKSRISTQTKVIDGTSYPYGFTYNSNGQLQQLSYPERFAVNYTYSSATGKLEKITRSSDNSLIYQINTRDPIFKTPTLCTYGNGVATQYSYNQHGLVTQINTGAILNYNYTYNTRGVMDSRSETTMNWSEYYTYDNLDRLTEIYAGRINGMGLKQTFSYYGNGNFSSNSKLGVYSYDPTQLHAVTKIEQYNDIISTNDNNVTYNFFNQPTNITEGDYELELYYGSNQRRNKAVRYHNNNLENTRYYINKYYEKEIDSLGVVSHYHYIYAGGSIVALHITRWLSGAEATDSMYYVHTDHLGSYCAITNKDKTVRQRNFFEPWGNNIGIANYSLVPRGFTGHEHYPQFEIINMNGRLYDPVIARFFSPDKYVANSSFTQDFNRYTYARGCPLMYTDPNGEIVWFIPVAIAIGVALGAYQGYKIAKANDATGWDMASYMFMGGFIGGLAAGVSMGVGAAVGGALAVAGIGGFAGGAITGAAAGVTAGTISGLGMGGLAGKTGSDLWKSVWQGAAIGMVTGAVVGGTVQGISSALKGNNFWTGKPNTPQGFAAADPKTTTTSTDPTSEAHSTYDAKYQDPSQAKVPEKLYHYTKDDPGQWTEIRPSAGKTEIYFTDDGGLNRVNAQLNLATPKAPAYRIEILTSDPNFNFDNIELIRSVTGNVNNLPGGGYELIYHGTYLRDAYYQWTITIVP